MDAKHVVDLVNFVTAPKGWSTAGAFTLAMMVELGHNQVAARGQNIPDPSAAKINRRMGGFKQFDTGTHRVGHPPEHGRLRAPDRVKAGPNSRRTRRQENKEKELGTGKRAFVAREVSERCKYSTHRQRDEEQTNTHRRRRDKEKKKYRITSGPGNRKQGG